MKLFRSEFIQGQKNHLEGRVLILDQPHTTLLAAASILILLLLILFVALGSYSRKARLDGVLMPSAGIVKIMAQTNARVDAIHVREGEIVFAGQKLYNLNGERFDGQGQASIAGMTQALRAQLDLLESQKSKEARIKNEQRRGFEAQLVLMKEELDSLIAAKEMVEKQERIIRSSVDKYDELTKLGYFSVIALSEKQLELVSAEVKLNEHRQAAIRVQRSLGATQNEIVCLELEMQARVDEINRQIQGLNQQLIELSARGSAAINAPFSGAIAAILALPGQTVSPNEPMLMLVPDSTKLQVELYAPSNSVGFVKVGQKVGLRFSAYPHEKFGIQSGYIRDVSKVAITPNDVMIRTPFAWDKNEAYYRVVVELEKETVTAYGEEEPLKVGMAVSADVSLDSRKIYEWVLEPLWALHGKI